MARLEGAWEQKEAEAAQVERVATDGGAEQQADVRAAESTAKVPSSLGEPARKRSRLQTQAVWQTARVSSPPGVQVTQHRTARIDGCAKGLGPSENEEPVTVRQACLHGISALLMLILLGAMLR